MLLQRLNIIFSRFFPLISNRSSYSIHLLVDCQHDIQNLVHFQFVLRFLNLLGSINCVEFSVNFFLYGNKPHNFLKYSVSLQTQVLLEFREYIFKYFDDLLNILQIKPFHFIGYSQTYFLASLNVPSLGLISTSVLQRHFTPMIDFSKIPFCL